MKDLTATITKIQADITDSLKAQARLLPHTSNWASVLPCECIRQQVYLRLDWEKQSLPDPRLQGIFNTGNLVEDMTIVNLNQIGVRSKPKWELLKMPDKINDKVLAEHQIGSVTDVFLIVHNDGAKPENLGPVEIKSVDPNIYRVINSISDFDRYWWMKRYPGQLTTYMFGSNFEQGIFLLVNKTNWFDYKWLPYNLDVGYMQKILNTAKIVNSCVVSKTYPDRTDDRTECEHCPFKTICLPDESSEMIGLSDNEELVALLDSRDSLKEFSSEYNSVDKRLKEIWNTTKPGTYLVGGKYQVILKTTSRKGFTVEASEYIKSTITKVK